MGAWLIRPLILIEFGGVVFRVAVFHRDAARQDRGHVVPYNIPLLLLPLLLHLAQLEALPNSRKQITPGIANCRQG